jgi:hypothetical protein
MPRRTTHADLSKVSILPASRMTWTLTNVTVFRRHLYGIWQHGSPIGT